MGAALGYEFRMQLRRWAMWVWMVGWSLLLPTGMSNPWNLLPHVPAGPAGEAGLMRVVVEWAIVVNFFQVPFGLMLADRLARDRRLRLGELLETMPVGRGRQLLGKYLGSSLATLLPVLVVYAAGVGYVLAHRPEARVLLWAAEAFAAVMLPGFLFVGAYSVAVPAVLPVALYQVLYVGYWFWGNALNPRWLPTLSGTILVPAGDNASLGFFGVRGFWVAEATPLRAVASIALLLALAVAVLRAARAWLGREGAEL
ncbi:MAG: hypothetical protein QJR08_11095 [Bacillota bacterium]|nr:hypothetical protein [Bacillota bacterium]